MTAWKPKTIEDVLSDAIGSAINDNSLDIGDFGPTVLHEDRFDKTIKQAISYILESEYIEIKWRG